jgi:hypothetical protein
MLAFPRTAAAGPGQVETMFKQEVSGLNPDDLPLQEGMAYGNVADGDEVSAMVIRVEDSEERRRVKAGLFFTSRVTGCACADDPTPESDQDEYCEAVFDIRRSDGAARVSLAETGGPDA